MATLAGLRLYQCPLGWFTQETMDMIRVVYLVEHTGRLFWPGEWADQPAWLVEAYELYKQLAAEYFRTTKPDTEASSKRTHVKREKRR